MAILGLISVVFGSLILSVVVTRIIAYWKLKDIPGPVATAFLDLWFSLKLRSLSTLFLKVTHELYEKYGRVVRVGPNRVHFSDPEAVPVIYSVKYLFRKVSQVVNVWSSLC